MHGLHMSKLKSDHVEKKSMNLELDVHNRVSFMSLRKIKDKKTKAQEEGNG